MADMGDSLTEKLIHEEYDEPNSAMSLFDEVMFHKMLDTCLDKDSLDYDCFSRYYGIDGQGKQK